MDKKELQECKEEFVSLLKSTSLSDGLDDFIAELDNLGFFTAPASMKGHLCYEGGLLVHSLNVYHAALKLKEAFAASRPDVFDKISDESIIIATLLHDVCKAGNYFRKRNARFESGEAEWGTAPDALPVGHGEKSVIMLLRLGLELNDDEICAIRWHMGPWAVNDSDGEEKGAFRGAERRYALVTLVQMADTAAAHFLERKYETIN